MNLQCTTVQRVRDTSSKAIGAGAQTVDADLGHPDLTQFANELAAAPPDAGPDTAPTRKRSPLRRHGGRSA
jgi:hypothetical protein